MSADLDLPNGDGMDRSVNVLAMVKDGQRYVFMYDDNSFDHLLQMLGRYAADPELNFSWYDAAVMSQKVRRLQKHAAEKQAAEPTSEQADATPASLKGPHKKSRNRWAPKSA